MLKHIFIFSIISNILFSQIHVKKQKYFEVNIGALDGFFTAKKENYGRWVGIQVAKYQSNQLILNIGANYVQKFYATPNQKIIGCEQIFINQNVGVGIFLKSNKKVYFNPSIGTLIGYELINRSKYLLENNLLILNKNKILLGGIFGTELEFLCGTKYSLILKSSLIWQPTSTIQKTHFANGLGFRFNFF